ncbi:MAG: hypothetical protein AAF211_04815 [Myxococcota bacterium]
MNLVLTVLLGLVMLYWLFVAFAGLGMDSLDFDFGFDAEIDADLDVDVDVHAGHADVAAAGLGLSFLRLIGLGEVPLLVLLSFQLLFLWVIGVAAYPLVGDWGLLLQIAALIPSFILALIVTSTVTYPLRVIFRRIKASEKAQQKFEFIGKRVRLLTPVAGISNGQAEIETDGAPLKLIVRASDPDLTIDKGAEAVIVSEDDTSGVYIVRPF